MTCRVPKSLCLNVSLDATLRPLRTLKCVRFPSQSPFSSIAGIISDFYLILTADAFAQAYPPSPNSTANSPSPRLDYDTGPPVYNPSGSPPPSQYPASGSGPSMGYSYGGSGPSSTFLRPPKQIVQSEPKPSSAQKAFKSNNPFQKDI